MKRILSFLMAFLAVIIMTASGAQAFNETDHVYSSKNMVGDALIFPLYLAVETWKTNLRVVNTSNDQCVVAKVVFREGNYSCEARDFLIYLTPNDVWTADVVDVNGVIHVQSTDDSGPENPMDVPMGIPCNGGPTGLGYVEVYQAASFLISRAGNIVTPLDKSVLKSAYTALIASAVNIPACGGSCTGLSVPGITTISDPYSVSVCQAINVLTGREEVGSSVENFALGLNAEALANNCNTDKLVVQEETTWGNYGNNTGVEVRAALAKQEVFMPFNVALGDATFGIFTFPVKESCCLSNSRDCDGDIDDDEICCVLKDTDFGARPYDMEENTITVTNDYSPVPPEEQHRWRSEVVVFDATDFTASYSQGWVRFHDLVESTLDHGYAQEPGISVEYNGSAVIPTALECKDGDLYWLRLPYECGMVNVSDASTDGNAAADSIEGNGVHFDNCGYQDTSLSLWWVGP